MAQMGDRFGSYTAGEPDTFDLEKVVERFVEREAKEIKRDVFWLDFHRDHHEAKEYGEERQPVTAKAGSVVYGATKSSAKRPNVVYTQWVHNGQASSSQTTTIERKTEHKKTASWHVEAGFSYSGSVKASASIWKIVNIETEHKISLDLKGGYREEVSDTETFSVNQVVTVPPMKSVKIDWIITDAVQEVPWTSTVTVTGDFAVKYTDGSIPCLVSSSPIYAIAVCKARRFLFHVRHRQLPPKILFGGFKPSPGYGVRMCKVLCSEWHRQARFYRECLFLMLQGTTSNGHGGGRWREGRELADATAEFHWRRMLSELRAWTPKEAAPSRSTVHTLGQVSLPESFRRVLDRGPKFAVKPKKSRAELLILVWDVARKVPEAEAERSGLSSARCACGHATPVFVQEKDGGRCVRAQAQPEVLGPSGVVPALLILFLLLAFGGVYVYHW
ncbi:uncharacterized protein ISCGN_020274 [Ixodes scapularis]